MTSFRLDPEKFRTIAVYNDSLAFIVSPRHRLAKAAPRLDQRSGQRELHRPQRHIAATAQGDRSIPALSHAVEYGHRSAHDRGHQALCGHGQRGGAGAAPDHCPRTARPANWCASRSTNWSSSGCSAWYIGGRPRSPTRASRFCESCASWLRSTGRRTTTTLSGRGNEKPANRD